MHIAYITSEFITEKRHGGLATYLMNIAGIMSSHGHRITVITLSDQAGEFLYAENIKVIRVPAVKIRGIEFPVGHGIDLLKNSWRLQEALRKENKRVKIDIVQAANYQAVGFFRSHSIPTITRISSDSSMWRNAEKFEFDYKKALSERTLEDLLELWSVKRADTSFAPSRFCASVIQRRAGKNVSVIESPYFEKQYEADDRIYREKLFQKEYLLFNSSLSRLKGTHIVIEATESLMERYPDLYIVYAGYDCGLALKNGNIQSVSEILKKQNKKYRGRVIYLKHLSHETLFPVIKHSLACVLPSRVDNLPNSCIEAMALGSIVIGTYGASFEQLIKNKENGLLIKRDSAVSLMKAVDYLMHLSQEERQAMREKAVLTLGRLSPENIYTETLNFYKNMIAE